MALSAAALNSLGLAREPFRDDVEGDTFYSDPLLEAQRERALQRATQPSSITLIVGEPQSGRSLMLVWLLANLDLEEYGFRARAGIGFDLIDRTLRSQMAERGTIGDDRALIELLAERLESRASSSVGDVSTDESGGGLVLAIDDADLLDNDTLAGLFRIRDKLISRIGTAPRIVLVGQPALLARTENFAGPNIERTRLSPFNEDQTRAYLRHRLQASGAANPDGLISADDAAVLHRQAEGRPGILNGLANRLLQQRADQAALTRIAQRASAAAGMGAGGFAATAAAQPHEKTQRLDSDQSLVGPSIDEANNDPHTTADPRYPTYETDSSVDPDRLGQGHSVQPATNKLSTSEFESLLANEQQHSPRRNHAQDGREHSDPSLDADTVVNLRAQPDDPDDTSARSRYAGERSLQDDEEDEMLDGPFYTRPWFVPAIAATIALGVLVPLSLSVLGPESNDDITREVTLPDFVAMRPLPESTQANPEVLPNDQFASEHADDAFDFESDLTAPPATERPNDNIIDRPTTTAPADSDRSITKIEPGPRAAAPMPSDTAEPAPPPGDIEAPDAVTAPPSAPTRAEPSPPPQAERRPAPQPESPPALRAEPPANSRTQATDPRPTVSLADDQTWIRSQAASRYTIQLIAARDLASAQSYAQSHNLSGIRYANTQRDGQRFVVAIAGSFASRAEAEQALARLPASVRNDGAWLRTFDSLQRVIN